MAALLVSVSVMAIVMTALLPVWRQQAQREKEAELAFRGEQYARAIYLFNAKNGGMNPPSIDALVQGRYLRKKYKDPMTEDGEFQPLAVGVNQPGQPGPQGGPGRGRGPGTPAGGGRSGQPSPGLGGSLGGVQGGGGIATVVSKSKEPSIRIYYGASHYNEWRFLYNRQGRGAPGRVGGPGGGPVRGQPGIGAPGRGGPRGGPGGGFQGPGRGGGPARGGGDGRGNRGGPGRSVTFPGGRGQ
jgi:type II secretory pathway pseudopilin PulG